MVIVVTSVLTRAAVARAVTGLVPVAAAIVIVGVLAYPLPLFVIVIDVTN